MSKFSRNFFFDFMVPLEHTVRELGPHLGPSCCGAGAPQKWGGAGPYKKRVGRDEAGPPQNSAGPGRGGAISKFSGAGAGRGYIEIFKKHKNQ